MTGLPAAVITSAIEGLAAVGYLPDLESGRPHPDAWDRHMDRTRARLARLEERDRARIAATRAGR